MKLIVGLGNPGREYVGTRHNVGFEVVSLLARRWQTESPRKRFNAEIVEKQRGGEKVILACPTTYMNLSGESVVQIARFFQIAPADVLAISDDLNLEAGRIRLRPDGTAGGQKGLQNIINHLGTNEFPRLRIGIGRPPERVPAKSYVLSRFFPEEREPMEQAIGRAADAVEAWLDEGIEQAMNRFNAA